MTRPLQPHGTHAAYKRHIRRNQPACRACLAANTAATAARRQLDALLDDDYAELIGLLYQMIEDDRRRKRRARRDRERAAALDAQEAAA